MLVPKHLSVLCIIRFRKILHLKEFGFQVGYSTHHAIIIQLEDQIFEAFENNLYTLGVFIDLSKSL